MRRTPLSLERRFLELVREATGATSGLGEEAAAQLANAGSAKVIVTGRTSTKAEAAVRALTDRTGRGVFSPLTLDLDDPHSIDGSVAELASRGDKIDFLLLNAGLVAGKNLIRTTEGIEATSCGPQSRSSARNRR